MRTIALLALAGSMLAPAFPTLARDAAAATTQSADRPVYGTFGFDSTGMDPAVTPGDNFFGYANGGWLKSTAIPADKADFGMFTVLDDLSKQRTQGILKAELANPASRIGNAYASYLDLATVEARGLTPIRPWLDRIKALATKADYPALVAEAVRNGVPGPFRMYVGQDDKHPDTYVVNLSQGGIGLPDRDYYLMDSAKMAATRTAYVAHLAQMLTLAGESNAEARAAAVMTLETAIARAHWTRIDSRDRDKTYNSMTVPQLVAAAPGFDFAAMFRAVGISPQTVLITQPTAFTAEASLIAGADLAVLKDMLLLRSLDSYATYLPEAIAKESFAFNGTVLSGTPEREERWRRAVSFTSATLGDDIGKIYVAQYFPPATKAAADALVHNVIAAMGTRIDKLDWMAPETKVKAHEKLAAFTPKIGYPSQWRDYTGLDVRRDDLFGNALRSRQFEFAYNLGKLGQPIRRWEWGMTPMTINAYANFGMVEIVFPAAILQPPFFDPKADPAVNYGGIGVVIGHELSHHFDDQGAKYDKSGTLTKWWTPGDIAAFSAAEARLAAQYDGYEPLPGQHIQGKLTLGENSADLAGLALAYDAYHASLGGRPAPVIDGLTGDQRFYLGYAQVWRSKMREEALRQRLLTDPHSPGEYRVAEVRNIDAWYQAFGVQPGARAYLKPEDRVKIW
ncbi:M13-type metalloendopeptidase [Novosphingobium sp.]|uniref:M13 family metallopeptidase n=1 Tax=Novosphingobium sp. TaxID=1874826 RepID=UPI00333F359D